MSQFQMSQFQMPQLTVRLRSPRQMHPGRTRAGRRPRPLAPLGVALPVLSALALLFVVAFDQGQLAHAAQAVVQAAAGDSVVHEVFHDSRHMLGFPCH